MRRNPDVSVLCCNPTAWLPCLMLPGASIPIRNDRGIAAWRASWLCPRCASTAELRVSELYPFLTFWLAPTTGATPAS